MSGGEGDGTYDEYIYASLQQCFKNMDINKIEELATKLKEDGLSEEVRLEASEGDLVSCGLNKYQARALIKFWKDGAGEVQQGNGGERRLMNEENAVPINNQAIPDASLVSIGNFQLDWNEIYKVSYKTESAREVLKRNERPQPGLLKEIITEVVRQVVLKVQNVKRPTFVPVYYQLMLGGPHKKSFTEKLGQGTECVGGILYKLKTKFDNDHRTDRNSHRRDPDVAKKLYEQPRGKFSYGCPHWRVKEMLPGETEETALDQKNKMQEIFRETRPKFWDLESIKDMIDKTFKPQRDMINSNIEAALAEQKKKTAQSRKRKRGNAEAAGEGSNNDVDDVEAEPQPEVTINQISDEWPFLFTYNGMLVHFKILTKVDVELELSKFKEEGDMAALLQFFRDLNDDDEDGDYYSDILKKMDKEIKKDKNNHPELRAISLMLPKYFKEDSFINIVEETATMESAGNFAPQYPGLTIPAKHASLFRGKKFFLGVDCHFHYALVNFEKAFLCVYMMYYVFNLDYAPKMQITLEFLQRSMFHVDPPSGNKRPPKGGNKQNRSAASGQFSTKVVHPQVSRLFNKVQKYKRRARGEASDGDDDSSSAESGTEREVF